MTECIITITPKELNTLMEWIGSMDSSPHVIKIISRDTGIGRSLRAEIETDEGEGHFKDLTDYENW
jgi:hypothetical protein